MQSLQAEVEPFGIDTITVHLAAHSQRRLPDAEHLGGLAGRNFRINREAFGERA
jgi:hypothetical protein